MKRKLVKQGISTMMVSLPSKWIKENKLGKGDEVELEEADSSLLISTKHLKKKQEVTIKLSNLAESLIRTLITNTYRGGYDKIKVLYDNEKQFRILNDIIKTRLIGFEVIKKEENFCTVENVTEPSSEQFDNIMKKIFLNIQELFEITAKRLENKKTEENYEEVEQRIQKYDNFCRRVIIKEKLIRKSELFWTFLTLIIHGQREIYHLNRVLDKKINTSKKVLSFLEDARRMFELIMNSYLEKNVELLAKVHELEEELIYKRGYLMLKEKNPVVYHLMVAIREFYQANSPLSGLIL